MKEYIETGKQYLPANVGKRILAQVIDWAILFVYLLIVVNIFEKDTGELALAIILAFFYTPTLELIFKGQTFGKMIMNIKVVKTNGEPAELGNYLLRWLLAPVDSLFYGIVAIIIISLNKKGQRLGDIVAKTAVIDLTEEFPASKTFNSTAYKLYKPVEQKKAPESSFKSLKLPEDYVPKYNTGKLTEADILSIEQTIALYKKTKNLNKRFNILMEELERIEQKTGLVNTDVPALEFLETIIKDYVYNTSVKKKIKM